MEKKFYVENWFNEILLEGFLFFKIIFSQNVTLGGAGSMDWNLSVLMHWWANYGPSAFHFTSCNFKVGMT